MVKKKIAIVGTGFAGLATAWHLCGYHDVTLISSPEQKTSASGISAGLLHPYVGPKARINWRGEEGVQSTIELLRVASDALGQKVFDNKGILRIASSTDQQECFKDCAEKQSHVHWLSAKECQEKVPGVINAPGIFIESGITVYPDRYLKGLELALRDRGVQFTQKNIRSHIELNDFDDSVLCVGAGIFQLQDLPDMRLRPVKGQILRIPWPQELPALPVALNSKIYMVMSEDGGSCFVGSTFERYFHDEHSDLKTACKYILPKLYALYPSLDGVSPIECRSGIRVATPDHVPLVKQITPHVWVFTGLGSKGLLYHSLLAKELAHNFNNS
jgi:glycine/D-amino acid oxidase-like deaminating enzyme